MMRYSLVALGLAAAVSLAGTAMSRDAAASPVDWNKTFLLTTTGGLINPGVIVGFNPQPEPPAYGSLFSLNKGSASITVTGVSNPAGGPPQNFQFLFGAASNVSPAALIYPPDPVTDPAGPPVNSFSFGIAFPGTVAGGTDLTVIIDIVSSSGGGIAPGSDVMFNPQPEPPAAGFGDFDTLGLDFSVSSLSDVTLTLRIVDAQGNQLGFAAVPEPATAALLVLGLAALATAAGRTARRRTR